jgi:hypothetical protein
MLNVLKVLTFAMFALLTLGSGACTLLFLPSMGDMYVGYAPLIIGLPVVLVSGGISYLLWRSLRQPLPAPPKDEA